MAELGPATIINADASQVYADLRLLSARPSDEEVARAPHRLFGYVDGAEACSAARWAEDAKREIGTAHQEGRLPVLVGGTGLYLRTLLEGIAPVPDIEAQVRQAVRALQVADAHAALAVEDPEAAARLNPGDTTRVARALEVVRSTGRPLAEWQQERVGGIGDWVRLAALVLLPPREWLFERCDARFRTMLESGAIEEVERLRARRLSPALPVMRAIGVREIGAWLDGMTSYEAMVEAGQTATRQYAKRQYTWFRNQPPPSWEQVNEQLSDSTMGKLARKLYRQALTG